jgi:hypothetical protein
MPLKLTSAMHMPCVLTAEHADLINARPKTQHTEHGTTTAEFNSIKQYISYGKI